MTIYSTYNDEKLADLLTSGDAAAYNQIYNKYHAALYIHAFKRLQDREECKDLVQELFAVLWLKRDEIVFSTALSGYLFHSVRNRIFDILAKKKLKKEYISSIQEYAKESFTNTDHMVRQRQLAEIIEHEIAALPSRTREIFELSRKGFLSHREIATHLNISEQTVKTTVNNALKVLRVKLGSIFFLYL